ncbi:MAG: hypothetical protein IKL13_00530 [Clostridia bacterium]|nr:hypothetical protein [Clostridia bacterium]
MRYMRMPVSGLATVSIPQLNGGVNVYDVPNRVGDNQLTECDNLWWHGGALRTRPGLAADDMEWREVDAYTIRQRVGEQDLLMARFDQAEEAVRFYASHLSWAGGHQRLGFWGGGYTLKDACDNPTALGIRAKKNADTNWYYLLSNGEILKEAYGAEATEGWIAAEPYIPTVMINGVGEDCEATAEPTKYEDYNMLTRGIQCHYTTDGVSTVWKLVEGNLSTDLPGVQRESEAGGTVAKIELDVYGENGLRTVGVPLVYNEYGRVEEQSVTLSAAEAGVTGYGDEVSLRVRIDAAKGVLYTQLWEKIPSGVGAQVTQIPGGLPFLVDNNLRVTVWRSREHEKDRLTICKMTRGEWFGGDVSGIAGGTRFFVCGNPDEPDLLCWSGIEHPLYFPEHNRVRVGDDHQAITAMGKQGSLLVLYKERETYALQYSAGTESDYAFAEGVVAVTSYMAKFLLMPINASVGCDCPDTVRLVNNRLVWACSDGSVYMLTATNPYSERNVRMISRNVRRLLTDCGKEALQNAQTGEYEGYYLLLVGNRVFLMNTQTSAFVSFNYYNDEDTAAKAIPWFVWTLPPHLTYTGMVSGENTVKLAVTDGERGEGTIATLTGATDNGEPIPCRLTTKLWDFGRPDRKKSVEHLYMGLGCGDLSHLQVTYITERGRVYEPYRMQNSLIGQEGYLLRRHLTPNVRMVQAFGLCMESPTGLELDEIHMKIRQQGVVR